MRDILHRSDRVEVRRVGANDRAIRVVTFDSYHETPGTDRPGFGEAFFASEGVGAIHVLSHGNDWFHYAEMAQVAAIIRAATVGADRLLAYGSSMGGYAAVRFAGAIGAQAVLALSPQYAVDPRLAPFETRWVQDRRRIRYLRAIDARIAHAAQTYVAYDPRLAVDRCHVDAIASEIPVERLALPHAGHPAGAFLAETGLLRPLVLDILAGRIDLAPFRAEARARRTRSATWLSEFAAAQPAVRRGCAVALAQRAALLAPDHPAVLDRLALRLRDAGDLEGAIAAHRRATMLAPIPDYQWGLSKTLFAAGRLAEALAVARSLQAAAPGVAGYHRWAAEISLAAGDRRGARADLRAALARAPANRGYRWDLVKLAAAMMLAPRRS